ncbi:exopolysaccharide inner membrane protein [Verticillium dahliae]
MNEDFLNHVLGSEHNVKHFFANWKLCNIASAMAIGVLADNQTVWDFAVDYFKNGVCNGGTNNAITNIVEEQALIGPWARARSPDVIKGIPLSISSFSSSSASKLRTKARISSPTTTVGFS